MPRLILRRVAVSIPLLMATSLLVFILVANAGDPLADLRDQAGVPAEVFEARRVELGLDKPVLDRYGNWVARAAGGDLGTSLDGREVTGLLWDRMQVTLRMVVGATALALAIGLTTGVLVAVRRSSGIDHAITFLCYLALAMPVFWLAGLFKEYLAIRFNRLVGRQIIFTVGEADPNLTGSLLARLGNHLGHLALPTLALMIGPVAIWSRYVRASMLEALTADYVRTATAKGLPASAVVVRHALRNALAPFVTVVSLHFGHLFAGAVVIEQVFGWRGMGDMLLDGVRRADPYVVSAWLLVTATMVHACNFLADLMYAWLDPRIRRD